MSSTAVSSAGGEARLPDCKELTAFADGIPSHARIPASERKPAPGMFLLSNFLPSFPPVGVGTGTQLLIAIIDSPSFPHRTGLSVSWRS